MVTLHFTFHAHTMKAAHTSAVVEGTALVCDIQTRFLINNRVCMSHTSAVPSTTALVCAVLVYL